MKRLLALSAVALLSACSTTGGAPAQSYRAADQATPWSISGSVTKTPNKFSWSATFDIAILIDGERVLTGVLDDSAIDLAASFRGKRVEAACVKASRTDYWAPGGKSENARCTVFINNERAATLVFDV